MRGDAELVEIGILGGFVELATQVVDAFQLTGLGGDEAGQHALVALGQEAQGLEAAGALGVVFHEIDVDAGLVEHGICRRVVGAFGDPGGFEIATAHMHADHHVGRTAIDRVMHHLGILLDQPIGIEALGLLFGADLGVAQIGKEDVVHLKVPAADIVEGLDGLLVGLGEIGKQQFEIVAIGLVADIFLGDPEVAAARARDRNLGHDAGIGGHELEMLEHRMVGREVDLVGDGGEDRPRIGALEVVAGGHVALHELEAVQLLHEIIVPEGAANLAIGHHRQADILLQLDGLADRLVLDLGQLLPADRVLFEMAVPCILDG